MTPRPEYAEIRNHLQKIGPVVLTASVRLESTEVSEEDLREWLELAVWHAMRRLGRAVMRREGEIRALRQAAAAPPPIPRADQP